MRDNTPAHPEQTGRLDLDPSVRARIDNARQNLEATTYRPAVQKIPSMDGIDPKLQAYLESIFQSLMIEYEAGSVDVSELFDEFLLHADAIAMALRMNDANRLEQGLVQIAHQAVTKLTILNVSLFQNILAKKPNIRQVRPSDVFTCGVLFTDRLLQGFGHESVFDPKNAFEENIAHAILADSLVHVCRLAEYDPRVAVAEITGLFDRVRSFDIFYP